MAMVSDANASRWWTIFSSPMENDTDGRLGAKMPMADYGDFVWPSRARLPMNDDGVFVAPEQQRWQTMEKVTKLLFLIFEISF